MNNPFVICPYNSKHRVLKSRLQSHIVRCQKHYISMGLKPCPYNATHIIKQEEYRQHIERCPDVQRIEGDKYKDEEEIHGKLNQGAFHFDIEHDEDWESSTDGSSQILDRDCSHIPEQCLDSDEDEEPLFRYFFDKSKPRTVARLPEQSSLTSAETGENKLTINAGACSNGSRTNEEPYKTDKSEEVLQERISQYGAGRGSLHKMLQSLDL